MNDTDNLPAEPAHAPAALVRYATFDAGGKLTGCFLQVPPEAHLECMIEVDDALALDWPNYRANEARDGIELAPAPSADPVALVPQQVTMRQARLALLGAGLLAQVGPAIDSLDSPAKETARIEWDYSSTVVRDRPLVVMLGQALGLDDEALDQLFITAAGL